jgi:hypothetical protein
LGRLKKPSALPFAALHHPPWDYGIVFALRRDTAAEPGRGRSFYSCTYPSGWPIEGGVHSYVSTWLDPQRMRYGSLRSLAVLVLRLTEPTPLVSSSVGTSAWVRALANIVHNIRRGSSLPPSGRHGRNLTTEPDLPQLLRLGMGEPRAYSIFTPTTVSSRWWLRRCWTRHGGDSGEANGRNFRRRRSSLPSVSSFTAVALPQQLHNIKQFVSISIRSCCPWRWWAQVMASQRF